MMHTGSTTDAVNPQYVCTPESEDARYSRLYKRGYGVGPIHELFAAGRSWGAFEGMQSALDVGCGRGMALGILLNAGIRRVIGVDISSYAVQAVHMIGFEAHHGDLRNLGAMFRPGEFDLVWSCDVMEHLPEAWVDDALRAMHTVCAKAGLFSISTRASVVTDVNGGNLHLTVRPAEWWRERITQAGFIERHSEVQAEEVRILFDRV